MAVVPTILIKKFIGLSFVSKVFFVLLQKYNFFSKYVY